MQKITGLINNIFFTSRFEFDTIQGIKEEPYGSSRMFSAVTVLGGTSATLPTPTSPASALATSDDDSKF